MEHFELKKFRLWNIAAVGVIFFVGLGIAVSNIVFDHYAIFGTNWVQSDKINLNQRWTKVAHLAQSPSINALHLGSSKLGHFPSLHHQQLRPVSGTGEVLHWYNAGFFSAMPSDDVKLLAWMVGEGRAPKEVLIGFDYYNFFSPPDMSNAAFIHHPSVTGRGIVDSLFGYAFRSSFVYLFAESDYFFGEALPPYAHDIDTGRYLPIRQWAELHTAPGEYWSEELSRAKSIIERQDREWSVVPQTVASLQDLRRLLDQASIDATFYVQPLHRLTKQQYGDEAASNIDQALRTADIEVLRFDLVDCLGEDDADYFDVQHYRSPTAMAMLDVIYGKASMQDVCALRDSYEEEGAHDEAMMLSRLAFVHPGVAELAVSVNSPAIALYKRESVDKN